MTENPDSTITRYNVHQMLGQSFCRLACTLSLTQAKVYGREYLEALPRPYIILSNHCSHWDPVELWAYFPDYFNFLVKEELHQVPFFGSMSRTAGNIALHRDGQDIGPMKKALKHLKQGYNLAVFPEGTRTHDGLVSPFKEGGVALAAMASVPIVPVYIHGTWNVVKKHGRMIRSFPVEIHLLAPRLEPTKSRLSREEIDTLNQEIFRSVKDAQTRIMQRK